MKNAFYNREYINLFQKVFEVGFLIENVSWAKRNRIRFRKEEEENKIEVVVDKTWLRHEDDKGPCRCMAVSPDGGRP